MTERMRRVLFVCTGNICRSPMAEGFARKLFAGDHLEVSSAGTGTMDGFAPTEHAVLVMREVGIDIWPCRSTSVWDVAESADLIYALAAGHRRQLLAAFPSLNDRIELLLPNGESVADPLGQSIDAYRATRDLIRHGVEARLARWSEMIAEG